MAVLSARRMAIKDGEVVVRSIVEDEASRILDFARTTFEHSPFVLTASGEFKMTLEEEVAFIRKNIESPTSLFLAAWERDRIVGSLALTGNTRRKIRHQAVIGMMVSADRRGRGIGRALLRAVIDWARESPTLEILTLAVFPENAPAYELYRSMGFIEYGRLPGALRNDDGRVYDNADMYLRVKP
jgi:RimJ/RimL family protein N-acetyltransferase